MKTAIQITMRDPRMHTTATAVITVDKIDWIPLDIISYHDRSLEDFRPVVLYDLSFMTERYSTRYVPPMPQRTFWQKFRRFFLGPEPMWSES